MENIRELLDIKLLSQSFIETSDSDEQLNYGRHVAQLYAGLDNGISVLSDMKARKSYIWYGALAEQLGFSRRETEIDSIWEDELLSRVHPDDLQQKYRAELHFFRLLHSVDPAQRPEYGLITRLRVRSSTGTYVLLKHRLLYIASSPDGSVRLALCLYEQVYDPVTFEVPQGMIVNTRSGEVINQGVRSNSEILSVREQEVLQLIRQGRRSKEIAEELKLSLHTVNRHRQNILRKLNVSNAIEACRMAEAAGLL